MRAARVAIDATLGVPGEGLHRAPMGDPAVLPHLGDEDPRHRDDRGGERLPPRVHGRPQQEVRPERVSLRARPTA